MSKSYLAICIQDKRLLPTTLLLFLRQRKTWREV